MTRLTSSDIDAIPCGLAVYDRSLKAATGRALLGIGAAAAGWEDEDAIGRLASTIRMAVVPIRSGQGIIQGFTDDPRRIEQAFGKAKQFEGSTRIYDAIDRAVTARVTVQTPGRPPAPHPASPIPTSP